MYYFIFYFCNLKQNEKRNFMEGHDMENIKDRLAHIIRSKNLTASQFAEKMGVQPSNVSHLLNGRNNPSIEFLMKLKDVYPEYSFDWIIMGKKPITINEPNPVSSDEKEIKFEDEEDARVVEFDDIDEKIVENTPKVTENHEIDKIVIIYTDKTFEIIEKR